MTRVPVAELEAALGGEIVARVPYAYATSSPLDQLTVRFADGTTRTVILKDLLRDRLIGAARTSKPTFLHAPSREIDAYTRLLNPSGYGLRLRASGVDWFVLDKAEGIELWQVGGVATWAAVARWLADFHVHFAGQHDRLVDLAPALLDYRKGIAREWCARARDVLTSASDEASRTLLGRLDRAGHHLDALADPPHTLVHGEFYPSNVLVHGDPTSLAVWPVDWEMASVGPPLLDLAALTSGWSGEDVTRILAAYGDVDARMLDRCRLSLALQWIGWSPGWVAPDEHAHDWVGEALAVLDRLGS